MLVPPSIWEAVEESQHALLIALSTALHSSSFLETHHILNLLPSQRNSAVIYHDKDRISECRRRISDTKQKLEKIDALCVAAEGVLEMRLQPVGALPAELIRHVVGFIVESPNEWKKIFTISHISHTWRSAVFAMPKLFVSPNWSGSRDVLEEWIARAGFNPLHIHAPYWPYNVRDRLDRVALAALPYLHRIQSIKVDCEGMELTGYPPAFTSIFRDHPLPLLETVVLSRKGPSELLFRADRVPRLKDLHSFDTLINLIHQNSLHLRSFGMRVHTSDDLNHLMGISASQIIPFHLTIYNHLLGSNENEFLTRHVVRNPWENVTSLSLSIQGQPGQIGGLIRQLEMPRLISLELVNPHNFVFDAIVNQLPVITERSIKKLVVLSSGHRAQYNFIHLLIRNRRGVVNRVRPNLPPFRNLGHFALCDWDVILRRENQWGVDFETIKTFVADRKGVLKRLALPSDFRPKGPRGNEGSNSVPCQALTFDQESELLSIGGLIGIEYGFKLSHHNHRILYGHPQDFVA